MKHRKGTFVMERERLHVPKAAEVLAGKLRDEIIRGILKEGDDLASEAKLLEEFHTSKQTLRGGFSYPRIRRTPIVAKRQ